MPLRCTPARWRYRARARRLSAAPPQAVGEYALRRLPTDWMRTPSPAWERIREQLRYGSIQFPLMTAPRKFNSRLGLRKRYLLRPEDGAVRSLKKTCPFCTLAEGPSS